MVVSKYNWAKIKQDYFNSEKIELKEFLRHYLGKSPQACHFKYTTGWRKEKEAYKSELARKSVLNCDVEKLNTFSNTLIETKTLILEAMQARVRKRFDTLPVNELKQAWETFKVELGEPSTISKNENKNTNSLSIEQWIDEIDKSK